MARTTISLPDDLKKEMEQYDENWSSLAASAFQTRIDQLKAQQQLREGKSMSVAIERLKRSRKTFALGAESRGHKAGTDWALTKAAYADLKAIHDYVKRNDDDYEIDLYESENPARHFYSMIAGEGDFSPHMNGFLETVGLAKDDIDSSSPSFWLGFGEGAIEVFEKIPDGE
jgi:hypothetical protein